MRLKASFRSPRTATFYVSPIGHRPKIFLRLLATLPALLPSIHPSPAYLLGRITTPLPPLPARMANLLLLTEATLLTTLPQQCPLGEGLPPMNTTRVFPPSTNALLAGQEHLGKTLAILVPQSKIGLPTSESLRLPTRRVRQPRAASRTHFPLPVGRKPGTHSRPNLVSARLLVPPLWIPPSRERKQGLPRWQIRPSLTAVQAAPPKVRSLKKQEALQQRPSTPYLALPIMGVSRRRLFTTSSRMFLKGPHWLWHWWSIELTVLSRLVSITSTLLTTSRLTSWTTPTPLPSNWKRPRLAPNAALGTKGVNGSRKKERTAMFFVPTVVTLAGVITIACPGDLPPRPCRKAAPLAFVPLARKRRALAPLTTR